MFQTLLDFLFPRRSLTGTEGEWITEEERAQLKADPVVLETEQLRRQGFLSLDRLVAAADYRKVPLVRKAVHTLKYRGTRAMVQELSAFLASVSDRFSLRQHPHITPVPLHWSRRFRRGFNQAELLARCVAEKLGLTFSDLLQRKRATGSQVGRSRGDRLGAMENAFRVRRGGPVPPSVILVDDICTTGATMDACAKALKEAGASFVEGWVVAKD
ncbi:MAG: ComF family protein [Candidatus Peribacteraceae bacterium]|jgi:ComF family protein